MKQPTGTLSICADMNFAIGVSNQPNVKLLYVGENFIQDQLPPGFIPFSIFLPPYQALEAEVNGDMNLYQQYYLAHLTSKQCADAFATIATVLWAGQNVVLVIENGAVLEHMKFLIQFFINSLGIIPATPQNPFGFNQQFSPVISLLLFGFNELITCEDMLKEMPDYNTFVQLATSPMFASYNIIDRTLYNLIGPENLQYGNPQMFQEAINRAITYSKSGAQQLFRFI